MSDPQLEPLSPSSEALLELERAREASTPAVRAAILNRLRATLELPRALPSTAELPGLTTGARWGVGLAGKTLVALTLLSVGGLLMWVVRRPPPAPAAPASSTSLSLPAPTASTLPLSVTVPELPKPQPIAPLSSAKRRLPESAPVLEEGLETSPTSTLLAEHALLELARLELARGSLSEALKALESHQGQFPVGQLVEERESLWVQYLLDSKAFAEARSRGEAFQRGFPRSILLPKINRLLQTIPVTDSDLRPK